MCAPGVKVDGHAFAAAAAVAGVTAIVAAHGALMPGLPAGTRVVRVANTTDALVRRRSVWRGGWGGETDLCARSIRGQQTNRAP